MTNNQAITISNFCGILYGSKQITFGVANRLAKNAKVYSKLQQEVEEIKARGKERNEDEKVIAEEIIKFGESEYEGNFQIIDLSIVENLGYEEIPVVVNRAGQKVEENWKISDMLISLQELEIIK